MGSSFDLSGRVAVVTGGAGWVGSAICRALGAAGAAVVIASRSAEKSRPLVEELQGQGVRAAYAPLDVTDENSAQQACATVLAAYGKLDILVNNAGTATNRMIEDLTVDEWNRVMAVNAAGTFICCKAFSPPMLQAGRGSIINVSSIYGIVAADQRIYGDTGRNSSLVYAASKAAVIQMTRYLAVYWADKGVRVNCISPGGVARSQEPDFVERYSLRVPMGRMADLGELGGAVVFLASDAAGYITGQNLLIDGGLTAW